MLGISPDCIKHNSTMPTLFDDNGKEATVIPFLEKRTGADMILSPLDMPAITETLLDIHVAGGACLYQVKIGMDLPSSISDSRLWGALNRMIACTPDEGQRWLLYTGGYNYDIETDVAMIDGRSVPNTINQNVRYSAIRTSIRRWQDCGGKVEHLLKKRELQSFVVNRLMELKKYRVNPIKFAHKHDGPAMVTSGPLQQLVKAPPGYSILMAIDGVGEKLAGALMDYAGSPIGAIEAATDFDTLKSADKPKGLGKGTVTSIRRQFGIVDGFVVRQVDEEFAAATGLSRTWMKMLPEQVE